MQRRVIAAAPDALLSFAGDTRPGGQKAGQFGLWRSAQHLRQDHKHLRDAMFPSNHLRSANHAKNKHERTSCSMSPPTSQAAGRAQAGASLNPAGAQRVVGTLLRRALGHPG